MAETVRIEPAAARAIAGIQFFRNADMEYAVAEALGMPAPIGLGFNREADRLLLRLAPRRFCAMAPESGTFVAQVSEALAGVAAVTDQTDAWAIFSVSGNALGELLAKIVPVDVRPQSFAPGTLALTRAGRIDIRLWKLDEQEVEIAVARSMQQEFLHTLHVAKRSV